MDNPNPIPETPSAKDPGKKPIIRWVFRVLLATLVPLCFLGMIELGLRAVGFGYSTDFFLPSEIEGKDYFFPNGKFTYPFFPPALARTPIPMRMEAKKADGVFRIFLLGESAAYGDPDPSFGMGRYLEALLDERYLSVDFEVICVAITAINSHVILPIARDCAKRDGDIWIVYMGNNEMVGPFGAGTVFGGKAPSTAFVKAVLFVRSTRIGQLLSDFMSSRRDNPAVPESWEGIQMFMENQLGHEDPARLRSYENFESNLDDILQVAQDSEIPVVLSTVGSNLRDCAPFASLHSIQDSTSLQDWKSHFEKGKVLEESGSYAEALRSYRKAAELDPEFAELQYRIGLCQLAMGNNGEALSAFTLARDYDALSVRADTRINKVIRKAIERSSDRSVLGVDVAARLAEMSRDGIPGNRFFYEHVHFTIEGNYQVARMLADAVDNGLPASISAERVQISPDTERQVCRDRLAVTPWDQLRVWEVALGRVSDPPFTGQSSHPATVAYFQERMLEAEKEAPESVGFQIRRMYESALTRNPEDTLVRWNYAQFLERTGELDQAIEEGMVICRILPHAAWPHYFVGSLLARQGRIAEAIDYLEQSLEIQESLSFAQQELEILRTSHSGFFRD